jgi:hypothetical protein
VTNKSEVISAFLETKALVSLWKRLGHKKEWWEAIAHSLENVETSKD